MTITRLKMKNIEPRYTPEELANIDRIVNEEEARANVLRPGKEFSEYIKRVTR